MDGVFLFWLMECIDSVYLERKLGGSVYLAYFFIIILINFDTRTIIVFDAISAQNINDFTTQIQILSRNFLVSYLIRLKLFK